MSQSELIFGIHCVYAALRDDSGGVLELWIDKGRHDRRMHELVIEANRLGLSVSFVEQKTLRRLVGNARHQGAVARCRRKKTLSEADLPELLASIDPPALILVLDGITDPHNLGACLRTAEAAGVHAVIANCDRAAGITPTVRKVASGAAEHVPFMSVTNLARSLRTLKKQGVWLCGTDDKTDTCFYELELTGAMAIVMGAEGKGLRRLTRELCDYLAYLPMAGDVGSLNVSVATGICLYEALRQRRGFVGSKDS
jgi:23S rRNA (guanosine2251-2'-O)-methyltransferase